MLPKIKQIMYGQVLSWITYYLYSSLKARKNRFSLSSDSNPFQDPWEEKMRRDLYAAIKLFRPSVNSYAWIYSKDLFNSVLNPPHTYNGC